MEKIINIKEIKILLKPDNNKGKPKYYISLGDNKFFSQYETNEPLERNEYDLYILPLVKIFFETAEKYLRLLNIKVSGNSIFYEVITSTSESGNEIYCMIEFSPANIDGKILNKTINKVKTINKAWF